MPRERPGTVFLVTDRPTTAPVTGPREGLAPVMERNISALVRRREQAAQQRRLQDRVADAVTGFTGSMRFVVLHLVVYGCWVLVNVGATPVPRFDRSFVILATEASVEAIFLSTFVLISQNRMQAQADTRADLDLQVSLLSEHEVTRLISLVTQMARRMGIDDADNPELRELARDVAPEQVLDELEGGADAYPT
jgi:uncharacterized membrane protein